MDRLPKVSSLTRLLPQVQTPFMWRWNASVVKTVWVSGCSTTQGRVDPRLRIGNYAAHTNKRCYRSHKVEISVELAEQLEIFPCNLCARNLDFRVRPLRASYVMSRYPKGETCALPAPLSLENPPSSEPLRMAPVGPKPPELDPQAPSAGCVVEDELSVLSDCGGLICEEAASVDPTRRQKRDRGEETDPATDPAWLYSFKRKSNASGRFIFVDFPSVLPPGKLLTLSECPDVSNENRTRMPKRALL